MTDETLIAQIKEVGEQFLRLEDAARERGFEVRINQYGFGPDYRRGVEVLKKV